MSKGDLYQLRSFDPNNPGDIERINLMYYHPDVMKAKGYYSSDFDFAKITDLHEVDTDLLKLTKQFSKYSKDVMYSVVDIHDQMVGWVWFYQDNKHPLPTRVKKEHSLDSLNSSIFQLSYQKLMSSGWPKALVKNLNHVTEIHLNTDRKGVIVSGLAMSIEKLSIDIAKLYGEAQKIALYAYVDPDNIGSAKVLERNKFEKYGKQYIYDGKLNDLWVKII